MKLPLHIELTEDQVKEAIRNYVISHTYCDHADQEDCDWDITVESGYGGSFITYVEVGVPEEQVNSGAWVYYFGGRK